MSSFFMVFFLGFEAKIDLLNSSSVDFHTKFISNRKNVPIEAKSDRQKELTVIIKKFLKSNNNCHF